MWTRTTQKHRNAHERTLKHNAIKKKIKSSVFLLSLLHILEAKTISSLMTLRECENIMADNFVQNK